MNNQLNLSVTNTLSFFCFVLGLPLARVLRFKLATAFVYFYKLKQPLFGLCLRAGMCERFLNLYVIFRLVSYVEVFL